MAEPTKEQLMQALRMADEEGNEEAAIAIASRINAMSETTQEPKQAAKEELSRTLAAERGFEEGLTFSHSAELRAMPDTATEVLTAMGESYAKDGLMGSLSVLPSVLETHRKHTRLQQDVHDALLEKYPAEYLAGEMGGGALSETGLFGLQALATGGAAIGLSGVLSTHFLANFAHGVGKADTSSLAETINEGIEAGQLGMGVPVWAQKGVKAGARAGAKLGVEALKKTGKLKDVVETGVLKFLGVGPEATGMAAGKYNKKLKDMLYRVAGYTDSNGNPLLDTSLNRIDMLDKLETEARRYGSQMGANLSMVDEVPLRRNPANMFDEIDYEIFQGKNGMLNSGDIDKKNVGANLRKNLAGLFFEPKQFDKAGNVINDRQIREGFNASMVHDYMESAFKSGQKLNKYGKLNPTDEAYYAGKERIAKKLHPFLDDIVADANVPGVYDNYVEARMKFGDIRILEKQLAKTLRPDQKGAGFLTRLVNERLIQGGTALSLLTTGSAAYGAATNNKPLMYASIMGMGFKALYENPKVNGVVAVAARNVAEEFQSNPDKYNKLAGTLLMAASRGNDKLFMDTFGVASATVELSKRPLARTSQDLYTKQDAVLSLVNQFDPEVAKNLSEAINSGDDQTIAGIMVNILPKAPQGTVQQGIGWDGRAILPEEKEAVLGKLKTLSPRQRKLLIPKFQQDGIIPEEFYIENNPKPVNVFEYVKKQRSNIKKADY